MPFVREELLTHALAPHYETLRRIPNRRVLEKSELFQTVRPDLERILNGVERCDAVPSPSQFGDRLKVVAWNIQRGQKLESLIRAFERDENLAQADVLLLCEVDCGMARSHNRNVARSLADRLNMSYAFGVSYLVLEDDIGENPDHQANTLALAGSAVLSRLPLGRVINVDVPELRDKFSSSEKRLGKKRALVAEVLHSSGKMAVAACHLDSNASSSQRAEQLRSIIDAAESLGHSRVLLGGDLNTTTYDVSSGFALVRNLLHKVFTLGFAGAIAHYLTPEKRYERPIFELLTARHYQLDGYNDRAHGTMNFDLNDPYAIEKTRRHVGRFFTALLIRLLRPWNGCVPAKLDWFAGKGLLPAAPRVVDPRDDSGRPASDHAAIVVELLLSSAAAPGAHEGI